MIFSFVKKPTPKMEKSIATGILFIGVIDGVADKYCSATSKPPIMDAKMDPNHMNQRKGMIHHRI